jgi:hypothetical protein
MRPNVADFMPAVKFERENILTAILQDPKAYGNNNNR